MSEQHPGYNGDYPLQARIPAGETKEAFIHRLGGWAKYHNYKRREISRGVPLKRAGEKVGRNDPCPCGSGRKYKKCCGR